MKQITFIISSLLKQYFILILIPIVTLASCGSMNEIKEEHIVGNYYVGWNDMESNRSIYIKESPESNSGRTIVSGYVFAIGNNSRYIIAKSSPGPNSFGTAYHIIDSQGKYYTSADNNNYWMFMAESEFDSKSLELGISDLEFDRTYREDPW